MTRPYRLIFYFACAVLFTAFAGDACAWSCRTHAFIAAQAGMKNPEAACIPDAARNDNRSLLTPFHYHNAAPGTAVTPEYIKRHAVVQREYVPKDDPGGRPLSILVPHPSGVLYWKLVDLYKKIGSAQYSFEYSYARMSIAHFIGDLSQPLHNYPHGNQRAADGKAYAEAGLWAKENHAAFDNRYDALLPRLGPVAAIRIDSEDDLMREVARMANAAIVLADRCYRDGRRAMTDEEAASQVAQSVSLLKAVLESTHRSGFRD